MKKAIKFVVSIVYKQHPYENIYKSSKIIECTRITDNFDSYEEAEEFINNFKDPNDGTYKFSFSIHKIWEQVKEEQE